MAFSRDFAAGQGRRESEQHQAHGDRVLAELAQEAALERFRGERHGV